MTTPETQVVFVSDGPGPEVPLTPPKLGWLQRWASSAVSNLDTTLIKMGVLALVVACASILAYALKFGFSLSSRTVDWGIFGDYYGGFVGTVVSLIGVVAILLTLWVQQKELKAQFDNAKHMADRMAAQAAATERTAEIQRATADAQERAAEIQRVATIIQIYEIQLDAIGARLKTSVQPSRRKQLLTQQQKLEFDLAHWCEILENSPIPKKVNGTSTR